MRDFSVDHSALALNTATLGHNVEGAGAGWSPERTIDACASRGITGIVFWRREIGLRAHQIGQSVRAAGMSVVGLCRTPFLVGPLAPKGRQAVMDDFCASIDMAAALGAPVLTIVVGGVEPGTKGPRDSLALVADRVAEAAPYAAARGVKLALEPLNPVYGGNRSCLMTVRDAVDLCQQIDAPNLGIAVDVYHTWWDTSLGAELLRAGPERIFGFHLCDWLAETRDMLVDRGMMGDGVADLRAIRRDVEAAGYAGPCEVEVFSAETWWRRDPGEVLDVMMDRFRTCC
ncbi:TIM barrel protein [bacterium]|nr:TIM barrel protein [bacterium]